MTAARASPNPWTARDLVVTASAYALAVGVLAFAWSDLGGPWRSVLYHFVFALGLCILLPTSYIVGTGRSLGDIGLSVDRLSWNAFVGIVAACVTVPWRLGNVLLPETHEFLNLFVAMCFSTLFEEIFFRGFLQTRVEAAWGTAPAIVISGLAFAFYHCGYGDEWRHVATLTRMTLVGMLFAGAFAITNSVATSFLLNLPHAIVTFLERRQYFDGRAAVISAVVVIIALSWLRMLARCNGQVRFSPGTSWAKDSRQTTSTPQEERSRMRVRP